VLVIPDSELDPDNEPLLHVEIEGPERLATGVETTLVLRMVGANALPTGMKLAEGKLMWMPSRDQVGPNTVALNLTATGLTRRQEFSLHVSEPSVLLPLPPTTLAVSKDGSRLVAWSEFNRESMRKVTVEGTNLRVLADRTFPQHRLKKAVIGGDQVFLVWENLNEIEVLSATTLEDAGKFPLEANGFDLEIISDGQYLAYATLNERSMGAERGTRLITLPDLTAPAAGTVAERLRTGLPFIQFQ
jgi:hypothetical protein